MSTITDVSQIPGFNQQQYDALIQQAKKQQVDVSLVTSSLLEAVNSGKSFTEAMNAVKADLPKLAPPNMQYMALLANWPGLPSPGAAIMALITELSAEQRQQNKELAWAQTEALVNSMKDQAKEMKTMAAIQLAMGISSAAISIAAGAAQAGVAGGAKGLDSGASMALSTKAQGIGMGVGGSAKLFDAGSQFAGSMYQAKFKEMEADQETMRALRESIKDLNDALKELIQKSLSSSDNIQQGRNQALTRILA